MDVLEGNLLYVDYCGLYRQVYKWTKNSHKGKATATVTVRFVKTIACVNQSKIIDKKEGFIVYGVLHKGK